MTSPFDARPIVVAIAGPNGAGKTTFHDAHLRSAGLRFVNADALARELGVGAYEGAEVAQRLRQTLLDQGESFVFETVLSDPVGEKVAFLAEAARRGYGVVLCFVGIDGPEAAGERVAMRVLQGGHDVPAEKLAERWPRTMANLERAIRALPHVLVFDNADLARPFREVAEWRKGRLVARHGRWPRWMPTAPGGKPGKRR